MYLREPLPMDREAAAGSAAGPNYPSSLCHCIRSDIVQTIPIVARRSSYLDNYNWRYMPGLTRLRTRDSLAELDSNVSSAFSNSRCERSINTNFEPFLQFLLSQIFLDCPGRDKCTGYVEIRVSTRHDTSISNQNLHL